MKRFVLMILACFFYATCISYSQDFDRYIMMKDIMAYPDSIKSICSDSSKVNSFLIKRLNNVEFISYYQKYLKNKFSSSYFIKSDTIVITKDKGKTIGTRHKIIYSNEFGDIFCFQFYKKLNKKWELIDFGDYEVWYPRTKCPDDE